MTYLWRLRPYFRQVLGLLVIGSLAGLVMNVAVVLPPLLLGRALDTALAYSAHRAAATQVALAALALIAGTAATELPRIGKRYWLGVARTRIRANLRSDALVGILASPRPSQSSSHGPLSVGELMSRIVGDVDVIGSGVAEVVVETWDSVLFSISLVIAMFVLDRSLAALALSPLPIGLGIALLAGWLVARRTVRARESAAHLARALHERINGLRLLRLYGRAMSSAQAIGALAARRADAVLALIRLDETLGAVYSTLLVAGVVFVIVLGGADVAAGRLSVGGLVAFVLLFNRFTARAPRLAQMFNRVQAGGAAYTRVAPLLAPAPPAALEPRGSTFRSVWIAGGAEPPPPATDSGTAATLRFTHAGYTPPNADRPVLHDIDLDIAPGTMVAITGPVGAGKSTLARLACGLLAPTHGEVTVNGHPAAQLTSSQRAAGIGYLGQEPQLFSGSIAENVGFFQDVPTVEIEQALRMADFGPDLAAMPDGLQTPVGELGIRVSGGQRLRIALARAVARTHPASDAPGQGSRGPGLLVLDDPFAAVDVETEATIIRALRAANGPGVPPDQRATILLFSHRLAAFAAADQVVVLQAGAIAERGTHEELVRRDGAYAAIVRAQSTLAGTAR